MADPLAAVAAVGVLAGAAAYLGAVAASRRRGAWPAYRAVLWCAGMVAVASASAGPLAVAADEDFAAHMAAHVLLGMLAPLLLVLAAPVTLALRTLPVRQARRLATLLRARPVRILTQPAVAATVSVGGLWLLYRTPLYLASTRNESLHWAVHAHVFLAGYLFVTAIIGPDPAPHRAGHRTRAGVLLLYLAAHSILAKSLYADPVAAVPVAQSQRAGMLMYYGGDAVDLALLAAFCRDWLLRRDPRAPVPARACPTLDPLGAVAQPVRAVDS
jgi:putative membrane protein